jgi:CubicO group peptidase (beta-lactamase class C family)
MIGTSENRAADFRHAVVHMEAMVATGGYTSAVAAVADRSSIRWQHAVSGSTVATPASIFPIASITKTIVATAIMQLVERGCSSWATQWRTISPSSADRARSG